MGKLIVLEGTDGSGKSTQFRLLTQWMEQTGHKARKLVFPQYSEMSSALIRMYLQGEFGDKPGDVNAYAASTFYAVDRYASYRKDWGKAYAAGELILADRYTTSNAVHQGAKLPQAEREPFFRWLAEFEWQRLGLPRPQAVLYLDVPTEVTLDMLRMRQSRTGTQGDIHEKDAAYLRICRETGLQAAQFYGWQVISCAKDGAMRDPMDIHGEIVQSVRTCLAEQQEDPE